MSRIFGAIKKSPREQEVFLFLIMVVFIILTSLVSGVPFTLMSLFDLLKSSSAYLVYSVCVLLVMLSGGIDVSFSSIAAASAYVAIYVQAYLGWGDSAIQAFAIAALVGIVLGSLNAVLVSFMNLPPLIITLATSNIIFGALLRLAPIIQLPKMPPWVKPFGASRIFELTNSAGKTYGLSYLPVIALVFLAIFALFLKHSSIGRNIYALGSSREAARRAGVSITRTNFVIYCLVGMLAGMASLFNISLVAIVQPYNIQNTTMDVIAAVVLGGAALSGGKGSITGCLLGVLFLYLIKTSLIKLGIPSTWDSVIVGGVLIVSIMLTMIRTKAK